MKKKMSNRERTFLAILEAMIPCLTSSTFGSARCSAGVT